MTAPDEIHERLVSALGLGPRDRALGAELRVVAVGAHEPCLAPILQRDVQNFPEPLASGMIGHRRHHFHPMRQVPGHPIGRADQELALQGILTAGRKMKDSPVLEEPADDGSNANRLAEARDARPQAAESAH